MSYLAMFVINCINAGILINDNTLNNTNHFIVLSETISFGISFLNAVLFVFGIFYLLHMYLSPHVKNSDLDLELNSEETIPINGFVQST